MDSKSITDRLANLSPAKRALLEQRLKGKGLEALAGQNIPLRVSQEFAPLSFAQERMWFLNQLEPESPRYNEPRVVRLMGTLDVEALEKALNDIIARHEVLRTTIVPVDEHPIQRISDRRMMELPLVDLREPAVEKREAEAQRLVNEAVQRPFNLSRDLMVRVLLLRLEDEQHILVLVKHHVASDGWSSAIFWQELTALYEASVSGRTPKLRELPVQYADYAAWQREWLQGDVLESQLSYWRKQLENLAVLQLSTDRPRPAIQSSRGARKTLVLPKSLSQALKVLSRAEGVTLFMTLLAAFQALLCRYTGQQDIAVGSPIAGRNRVEVEGLIGLFVNTLVLRTHISSNPTFRELLSRVRAVCLDAYSHQDLPFERLVEDLQPQRNLTYNPLFQVTFQLNSGPRAALKFPGLEVQDMEFDSRISKFDLSLSLTDRGEDLAARLQYNTDLFDDATIARMLGHFQALLGGIVANPEQRISDLPILTEAEKHQVLVEWKETKRDYSKDKCIHQLFEEQVKRTPEAIAVVFENQGLTYRELNNRANQLAHYLRRLGVGPEVLVGICMERSLELVVGILGIIKAGGAYVPLDPSYPAERLELLLVNAQVSVLVIQESLFEEGRSKIDDGDGRSTRPDPRIQRLCLDRDWALIARESDANPEITVTADNLAYVIYTSGSTGQPKAVQITHKSLLNLVLWHHQAFSVTPFDRATQLAGPAFDAAVWELWPYLTVGASIHIPDEMTRLDGASFRDWLVARAITISFVPTALAENLVTLDWPQQPALRSLLTGGDILRVYPPETLPFRIFNNYGPTECTVVTASAQVWPNAHPLHFPTIGRPIANTQIYILDAQRNPVPIGVTGEIYIGGEGVARGYLNQPELTAEKFIYHSFEGEPARRLYRTGDLARYLADGNIEFLGRSDNQVKLRGYRIELGEIEAVLGQHPMVQSSVVVVREDTPGDKRLVGYVVTQPGESFDAAEVRKYLKQKLPEYMIPSALVLLDELPLTPNGKVDRKALPAPDQGRPELGNVYQAPCTAVEEALASIWSELLKVDQVGIHDNFFDLGGHSLLATQIVSRVRSCLSVELPLRTLFEKPTIEQMAAAIMAHWKGPSEQEGHVFFELESLPAEEARSASGGERHE